ncbi:AraC family transcriptional regulator [Azospirillum soli]|uniref:AraC family transcriptional regulator n=1 Tax=Azospirillum soli TaxID=1304799 RepID=UPI001AE7C31A|nr:helix-turn-helix transcriptional regulator [Azospirillum soli]MBP2315148.1 AraC-like DNA-binding protein [Azospirillum soli]
MRVPCTNPWAHEHRPQPILAMAKEYPHGARVAPHRHGRAQLLFATSGTMRVTTADSAWIVPPLRAVWIPPGMEHALQMTGALSMRTLFITPSAAPFMPDGSCRVIEVSGLLRALILAAVEEAEDGARAEMIGGLILNELERAAEVPLRLPLPRDPRLAALCRALLDDPTQDDTLEAWAERAGASARTLARLFLRETGLTFGAWRQQARLAEAMAGLALGRSVAEVARAAGYGSASAFTAMFRRALGATPSQYFDAGAARPSSSPGRAVS